MRVLFVAVLLLPVAAATGPAFEASGHLRASALSGDLTPCGSLGDGVLFACVHLPEGLRTDRAWTVAAQSPVAVTHLQVCFWPEPAGSTATYCARNGGSLPSILGDGADTDGRSSMPAGTRSVVIMSNGDVAVDWTFTVR